MKVSPNNAAPRRRDELPAGTYLVRIEEVDKILHGSGKMRIDFTYCVIAGEFIGRKMFDHCYLTDDAIWRLQRVAEHSGVTEEFDTDDAADMINKFVGKKLKVTTKADPYTNRAGMRVEGRKIVAYKPAMTAAVQQGGGRPSTGSQAPQDHDNTRHDDDPGPGGETPY
jgi:deoxyhypusine synthase